MKQSYKYMTIGMMLACIAYSLFFVDQVSVALSWILFSCFLLYLYRECQQNAKERIRLVIGAYLLSALLSAVFIGIGEGVRGYFIWDSVLQGVMVYLALGLVILTAFLILQEFLPKLAQVVLLILAGLYVINNGLFSYMLSPSIVMMGKAATDYILPWDLMGIALGIFLVELIVFALSLIHILGQNSLKIEAPEPIAVILKHGDGNEAGTIKDFLRLLCRSWKDLCNAGSSTK